MGTTGWSGGNETGDEDCMAIESVMITGLARVTVSNFFSGDLFG